MVEITLTGLALGAIGFGLGGYLTSFQIQLNLLRNKIGSFPTPEEISKKVIETAVKVMKMPPAAFDAINKKFGGDLNPSNIGQPPPIDKDIKSYMG